MFNTKLKLFIINVLLIQITILVLLILVTCNRFFNMNKSILGFLKHKFLYKAKLLYDFV